MNLQYYSLLLTAVILLGIVGVILLRNKPRLNEWLAFFGIAAALFVAWWVIRPVQTPLMGEAAAVQKMIGAGKPVLLEFQSPY